MSEMGPNVPLFSIGKVFRAKYGIRISVISPPQIGTN